MSKQAYVPSCIRAPEFFSGAKTLFLLRHGHSWANEQALINGTPDDPLTGKGKQQAQNAAQLPRLYGLKFNQFFVSHWKRARETAEIFLPESQFSVDCRLGETDSGLAAMMTFPEFYKKFPEYKFPLDPKKEFPEGESHCQVYKRSVDWFEETMYSAPVGASILAVTHVGPISSILQYICGLGMEHFPVFIPRQASISKLVQVGTTSWKLDFFSLYYPGN